MKIELKLFASLRRYHPAGAGSAGMFVEVSPGTTILGLLNRLGVPMDKVKLVFLNGNHAGGGEILSEGDRVGVFPPVAGG